MKIEAWINDEAEEYLMNLVAQEYFSEAQEFIMKLTDAFNTGLYVIAGNVMLSEVTKNGNKRKNDRI